MTRRPRLTATRGLPASGKTTFARHLQAEAVEQGRFVARCNRDEIRDQLHGSRTYDKAAEEQVTIAQQAQVEHLLRAGVDVVVDDMNLAADYVKTWIEIAVRTGADFELRDEFLMVPLETCIARDAQRTGRERVGEEFLRNTHQRYLAQHKGRLPMPKLKTLPSWEPYVPVPGAPPVVLVDIDGTVALRPVFGRSPYDMTRVGEDLPNEPVILAVRAMHAAGYGVVFCSGRDHTAFDATAHWIAEHVQVPYLGLFMREVGDKRDDAIVKAEIFDREVREKYRVIGVFDDRQRVVQMWRAHGLTVFQVAEGDF
ncbi:AAA family ATPase [Micromonospora sp. RV43]|uniref:phosphatase domain-containing protein n=1 Tax=Micromonospora sp. RV43 TaxID=1661387 RepID=UPI00064BEAE3|nr:AAA family ATPase [Micromonospora sp. RV43]